jgi:protein MAK11
MGKRKRGTDLSSEAPPVHPLSADEHPGEPVSVPLSSRGGADSNDYLILQVVVGSYERILHGIIARMPASPKNDKESQCSFADTFLFHAHSSAIRCLAVSAQTSGDAGAGSHKIVLASGGNDERINLYQLSSGFSSLGQHSVFSKPSLNGHTAPENPKNRELGSLLHHSAAVTGLCFPTRSKLLSAAEDNTIAITRTRDWTALSTIKAPMPRAHGRPSGDTAPPGTVPTGINSFAVHPSMKVMLSVSKGERCMRLWNLVKGTKAGVLKFDKEAVHVVGGGKWGSADAHVVDWSPSGDEFVIGFERGAIVYSLVSAWDQRFFVKSASNMVLRIRRTASRSALYNLHRPLKCIGFDTYTSHEIWRMRRMLTGRRGMPLLFRLKMER